jgi:hypothetical protein
MGGKKGIFISIKAVGRLSVRGMGKTAIFVLFFIMLLAKIGDKGRKNSD